MEVPLNHLFHGISPFSTIQLLGYPHGSGNIYFSRPSHWWDQDFRFVVQLGGVNDPINVVHVGGTTNLLPCEAVEAESNEFTGESLRQDMVRQSVQDWMYWLNHSIIIQSCTDLVRIVLPIDWIELWLNGVPKISVHDWIMIEWQSIMIGLIEKYKKVQIEFTGKTVICTF